MATATGIYHTTYRGELALRSTRAERLRLVLIVVVILTAPFVVNAYWLSVLDRIAIAVIGAVGLNILVGFTGLISLGQGGFLAVGAYTSGLLIERLGMPALLAMIVAVAVTAAVGTFFGLPALRLKGLYLAIATLASQVIILWVVRNWDFVTGGEGSSWCRGSPDGGRRQLQQRPPVVLVARAAGGSRRPRRHQSLPDRARPGVRRGP